MAEAVYPQLTFSDDADFNASVLNAATECLDLRLRALEGQNETVQDALNTITTIGLQRITQALQPIYDALNSLASIGAVFATRSTTQITAGIGVKTFIIPQGARLTFAPSGYLAVTLTTDARTAMVGTLQSYDSASGTLILNIGAASNPGMVGADWTISPTAPAIVPSVIDAGNYDGTTGSYAVVPIAYSGGSNNSDGGIF